MLASAPRRSWPCARGCRSSEPLSAANPSPSNVQVAVPRARCSSSSATLSIIASSSFSDCSAARAPALSRLAQAAVASPGSSPAAAQLGAHRASSISTEVLAHSGQPPTGVAERLVSCVASPPPARPPSRTDARSRLSDLRVSCTSASALGRPSTQPRLDRVGRATSDAVRSGLAVCRVEGLLLVVAGRDNLSEADPAFEPRRRRRARRRRYFLGARMRGFPMHHGCRNDGRLTSYVLPVRARRIGGAW